MIKTNNVGWLERIRSICYMIIAHINTKSVVSHKEKKCSVEYFQFGVDQGVKKRNTTLITKVKWFWVNKFFS